MLIQLIAGGLAAGALYALTAIGIVLIFKNTRVINLAQGDFGMMGAFIALILLKRYGMSHLPAAMIAIIIIVILAIIVERIVMRPIEDADWLTLFTATLGVFYILHGTAGWLWGRDTKPFPNPFALTPVSIGGALISKGSLVVMGIAALIGCILYLFFKYTKQGIAMRALTEDRVAARLMGIPVRRIIIMTWGVGGALAAISGMLLAPIIWVSPQMMDTVLIKGYAAAIFGGLYSLPGAVAGAIIIGVAENIAGGYIGAQFKVTLAFVLIVVVLAILPQGLFGSKTRLEV